jgi:hypothetical protein
MKPIVAAAAVAADAMIRVCWRWTVFVTKGAVLLSALRAPTAAIVLAAAAEAADAQIPAPFRLTSSVTTAAPALLPVCVRLVRIAVIAVPVSRESLSGSQVVYQTRRAALQVGGYGCTSRRTGRRHGLELGVSGARLAHV